MVTPPAARKRHQQSWQPAPQTPRGSYDPSIFNFVSSFASLDARNTSSPLWNLIFQFYTLTAFSVSSNARCSPRGYRIISALWRLRTRPYRHAAGMKTAARTPGAQKHDAALTLPYGRHFRTSQKAFAAKCYAVYALRFRLCTMRAFSTLFEGYHAV